MPEHIVAHATSRDSLEKILQSGKIKTLTHIVQENPEAEVHVEPYPGLRLRRKMRAEDARKYLDRRGNTDKVFLTRAGYDPRYGEYVIRKRLTSPVDHTGLTFIPNEVTTPKALSVRSNATVFVPEGELQGWREKFPDVPIQSKDELDLRPFTWGDRIGAFSGKLKKRLTKEAAQSLDRLSESQLHRRVSTKAGSVGSAALGTAVDDSDVDVFVPYERKSDYTRAVRRLKDRFPELTEPEYSRKREHKTTLSGRIKGRDVDLVLAYGEKPRLFSERFKALRNSLTEEEKKKIRETKARLQSSWVLPEYRYRRYKKRLAEDQGLAQFYF